jgi:hypothetical protein
VLDHSAIESSSDLQGETLMNVAMWRKALQVIPKISKEEWDHLMLSPMADLYPGSGIDHDLYLSGDRYPGSTRRTVHG